MADLNTLYYGDNLDVMRRHLKDESVDLAYLDPPFSSNKNYNVLFTDHGAKSPAQIKAFDDTWEWNTEAAAAFQEVVETGGNVAQAMLAFRTFLGDCDLLAYLSMMAPRLMELRRVLKPTGSIYLHADPTASHYLKMLMDSIFGAASFQNEIVWYYRGGGVSKGRFGRRHDILLYYTRGPKHTFNVDAVRTPYSTDSLERLKYKAKSFRASGTYDTYEPNPLGKHPDDVWELQPIMPSAKQRLGYPTQKPEALLERVILASSNEGDTVLDCFCGCGTTVAVAQRLKRRWIGIDVTHLAIGLIKHRLVDAYGPEVEKEFKVIGEPTTLDEARQLVRDDPFQFQFWVLGKVGARSTPADEKRGADKGIDGRLYFHDSPTGPTRSVVISVKGGKLHAAYVRDLRGVLEREGADIAVLLSMDPPTGPMRSEAASAGFYKSPWGNHPRMQIITVEELLAGKRIDYPAIAGANVTFRTAPKASAKAVAQGGLFEVPAEPVDGQEEEDVPF